MWFEPSTTTSGRATSPPGPTPVMRRKSPYPLETLSASARPPTPAHSVAEGIAPVAEGWSCPRGSAALESTRAATAAITAALRRRTAPAQAEREALHSETPCKTATAHSMAVKACRVGASRTSSQASISAVVILRRTAPSAVPTSNMAPQVTASTTTALELSSITHARARIPRGRRVFSDVTSSPPIPSPHALTLPPPPPDVSSESAGALMTPPIGGEGCFFPRAGVRGRRGLLSKGVWEAGASGAPLCPGPLPAADSRSGHLNRRRSDRSSMHTRARRAVSALKKL
mmetsp:Transcript_35786/g.113049  ORF Transcript_35786/g.113049 Transcript_35786/m.113049 type:complete len:287 (+) Transcript_35786:1453-2313(+)